MFDSMPFFIKKSKFFPNPIPIPMWIFLEIAYLTIPFLVFILLYLDTNIDQEEFKRMTIFLWAVVIRWIFLFIQALKIKNLKNLKYNWWWMLKKAKVTAIKKVNFNQGRWWNKVEVYYFEAEDWGMIYYSNGYTKGTILWTPIQELQLLYARYWFIYNENHNQKEDLLRKIDEEIAVKEHEIENSWFISKNIKGFQLWNLKKDRKSASDGYIPPYWEINGNRVTVWDLVDIYLDPINPEKYRIDTEFLF